MMTSKKRSWISIIGILIVLSMILGACAQPEQEVQTVIETIVVKEPGEETVRVETVVVTVEPEIATPEPGPKVLRINPGTGTYPDIIDPQKSSFVGEIAHLKLMYEGLTRLNPNLETVPAAAETWEYNEDATELTFTLREGLKYYDGSPLNALRFRYSLLRTIDPATAGEYAGITDEIYGASEWRLGEEEESEQGLAMLEEGIQALDLDGQPCADYEQEECRVLKLKFARPAPYFHTVMSLWVVYPAKEELIAEGGDNWWNSSKYHVGNGPYILTSLEPFVRGYFVPNPYYWGGQGAVDIEFSYITDTAIAYQAYLNDEFDIIALAAEDYETVMADEVLSKEAMIYPGSCSFVVNFHHLKEPFTDPKVRAAFATAVDREAWVRDVLHGLGAPTLTWIPPCFPGYQENETRWGYDPEAARELIADSSYGSIENLPPIVDTFGDTPRNRVRNEWLVAKWNDVFGIDIELNPVEPTTYTAISKDQETAPQMFIMGWCADYPDPQNWLSVYWTTGSWFADRIAYSNPDLDAILLDADTEVDPVERMALYKQAQDMLIDSVPGAFMWNDVNNFLVKPWVVGISTTPQDADWPGSIDPLLVDIDTSMMP
jgi:oligopeptide transport system substrate-binding protein